MPCFVCHQLSVHICTSVLHFDKTTKMPYIKTFFCSNADVLNDELNVASFLLNCYPSTIYYAITQVISDEYLN